ncbi:MAG: DUF2169 domain-containing protein [Polyangiaceae bacterium]|nr:DUF2169 domain-containing protein [Polyangiaceae bacterium]
MAARTRSLGAHRGRKGHVSTRARPIPLALEAQEDVHESDNYWDDDTTKSLSNASDLVPFKARADVIVVGHAYAPQAKPVSSLVARVVVGSVDKAIEVRGDQHFDLDGVLSEPAKFVRMPLRWERAAGGPETSNPPGVLTGTEARFDTWGRCTLPNLVPVGQNSTTPHDPIEPVGFGPIAAHWPSRAVRLSSLGRPFHPETWSREPLPERLDPAFFNVAPRDQQLAMLDGTESLLLLHLHRQHASLATRLAPIQLRAVVHWAGGGAQELPLACDTLLIDADRGLAILTFRGQVALDHPSRRGRVLVTANSVSASEMPPRPVVPPAAPSAPAVPQPQPFAPPTFGGAPKFGAPPLGTPGVSTPGVSTPAVSTPPAPPREPPRFQLPPEPAAEVQTLPLAAGQKTPASQEPAFVRAATVPMPGDASAPIDGLDDDVPTVNKPKRPKTRSGTEEAPPASVLPFKKEVGHDEPRGELPSLHDTGATPFRRIEGALVGGSALGRSMRLKATPSVPPPTPAEPIAAWPLAAAVGDEDTPRETGDPRDAAPPPPAVLHPPPLVTAPAIVPPPPVRPMSTQLPGVIAPPAAGVPAVPGVIAAPAPGVPPIPAVHPISGVPPLGVPMPPGVRTAPVQSVHTSPSVPIPVVPPAPAAVVPPAPGMTTAQALHQAMLQNASAPPREERPFVPAPSTAAPPPPPVMGSLGMTGSFSALSSPSAAPSTAAPTPFPSAVPAPPAVVPGTLPLEQFPIDKCARIAARLDRRPRDREATLKSNAIDEPTWSRLDGHWQEELRIEAEKKKNALLKTYDTAYVAQIEEERGPISVAEYARLTVASERGDVTPVAAQLGIPAEATMRIRRVWIAKMARDIDIGVRVRLAVQSERER